MKRTTGSCESQPILTGGASAPAFFNDAPFLFFEFANCAAKRDRWKVSLLVFSAVGEAVPSRREIDAAIVDRLVVVVDVNDGGANPFAAEERPAERMIRRVADDLAFILYRFLFAALLPVF